jgi:serine protease AprX
MSLLATVMTAVALAAPSQDALTPPVAELAAAHPARPVQLIVQQQPGADVRDAVTAAGGVVERRIGLIDGLAVRTTAAAAPQLATIPGVEAVSVNAPVGKTGTLDPGTLASAYNQSIRAEKAWNSGYTGRGVGVAVIDTGIRGDLPDFTVSDADRSSRVVASAVVNPSATGAGDAFGHGTHVAGLIAGNGSNRPAGDPLRGRYVGVAPDARLISVKAGDEDGTATVLDVIDGLQFVVDHKSTYNIRVANLSLSSTVAESHRTDPLDAAVEAAWLKGIVVVAAAGNRGGAIDAVQYSPANDPWIITVGGVDDAGTKGIGDDKLAAWSSRGITQDGHTKPDVLAPGAHLVSTMPAGAAYPGLCPECVVEGGYFRVGGTSMAAAVTSGAVAVLLQAHPEWTPDQVKSLLVRRSRPVENQVISDGIVVDANGDPQPAGTTVESTIVGAEIALDKVLGNGSSAPNVNAGLPVNTLVNPISGEIDYTRASWTRASWTTAVDPLRASWTQAGWMRASWTRASWTATEPSCVDLERASWTRASWTDAELVAARAECAALLVAIDPTRASWTRASWTASMSWASSFAK